MTTYPEFHQALRPEWGAIVRKVISNDIGPKYAGVVLVAEFEDGSERLMDAMPYCLMDGSGKFPDIDEVCVNLLKLFTHPDHDWLWEDVEPFIVERQMDHLAFVGLVGDGDKKKKAPRGKPPICYAIYGMLRMLVALKQRPGLLLSVQDMGRLLGAGINPQSLGNPKLRFVPVSGHKKAGLKGKHGSERKGNDAFETAVGMMQEEGDSRAAEYLESLGRVGDVKKKKPRQDVVDPYLQGRRYLADERAEERKQLKRAASAEPKGAPRPKKAKK